jgi:dTMP kinase
VERESVEFHNRVAEAYERLAAAEPERITRLDASEPREVVHHKVMSRVQPAVDALS